jgi:hypothetical protein
MHPIQSPNPDQVPTVPVTRRTPLDVSERGERTRVRRARLRVEPPGFLERLYPNEGRLFAQPAPPQHAIVVVEYGERAQRLLLGERRSRASVSSASVGSGETFVWAEKASAVPGEARGAPDPSQILEMLWTFDWTDWGGVKSTPYPVDVTVGTITLVP